MSLLLNENKSIVKRDDNDCVFKKPLHPAPRRKKVFDEETYINKIESIIEREFYPDLPQLNKEINILRSYNLNSILQTPDSPATFDTPQPAKLGSETPHRDKINPSLGNKDDKSKIDKMGLDEFMAKYTSEDNASFEQVLDDQKKKWEIKHSWMLNGAKNCVSHHEQNTEVPSLMDQSSQKVLALTSQQDRGDPLVAIESWQYKTFNSLMFVPDAVESSGQTKVSKAGNASQLIETTNTRFLEDPFSDPLGKGGLNKGANPPMQQAKVGVDGKEVVNTPFFRGYGLMRSPSPYPGVEASPLMTWGRVEGTPAPVGGSTPHYKMPKTSFKDELLLRMTPKSKNKSRAVTPSAQNILNLTPRGDKALRQSYTPQRGVSWSPKSQSGSLTPKFSPNIRNSTKFTPKIGLTSPKISKSNLTPKLTPGGLTDGLLKLPTRFETGNKTPKTPLNQTPKTPCSNIEKSPLIKRKLASDFF